MKSLFIATALLGCALGYLTGATARAETAVAPVQGWQVYEVFHRHCADCHGGHRSKPKGDFGYVLDLARISADEKLVVPGDPDSSEIYLLIVDPDPALRMPPGDSKVPPVGEEDIALVRAWIEAGAGSGFAEVEPASGQSSTAEPGSEVSPSERAGRLHPLLVHFPVALILAALAAELLGLKQAARWCLWIGALGSIGAVGSGWIAAGTEGYRPDTVFNHRWLGVAAALVALASAGLLEYARRRPVQRGASLLLRALLLLAALLVALAGHTGGELVHGAW